MKKLTGQQLGIGAIILAAILGYFAWQSSQESIPEGFYVGNGRIEATEIDIASKLAGRIEQILVDEGDFVSKGQPLAIMQTDVLEAQYYEAQAQVHSAIASAARARANIVLRESDKDASIAIVAQRESELDAGQRRLNRSAKLSKTGAMAIQQFDDDETRVTGAKAAVATAKAQVTVAEAALQAAIADAAGAEANVKAAQATVERIRADIKDSTLIAPCDGRIQYRISQPGEVLPAGGKVLNLVDLSDVYMTFFLPSAEAGRIHMGNEARVVLDAAPEYPVPAEVTFVSSVAQFTPKTVETQSEREKLMFRVKAQLNKQLLKDYIQYVKTGLPGVTWVKALPDAQWPEELALNEEIAYPADQPDPRQSASSTRTPGKPNTTAGTATNPVNPDSLAEQNSRSMQPVPPEKTDNPEQTGNPERTGTTEKTGNAPRPGSLQPGADKNFSTVPAVPEFPESPETPESPSPKSPAPDMPAGLDETSMPQQNQPGPKTPSQQQGKAEK